MLMENYYGVWNVCLVTYGDAYLYGTGTVIHISLRFTAMRAAAVSGARRFWAARLSKFICSSFLPRPQQQLSGCFSVKVLVCKLHVCRIAQNVSAVPRPVCRSGDGH